MKNSNLKKRIYLNHVKLMIFKKILFELMKK